MILISKCCPSLKHFPQILGSNSAKCSPVEHQVVIQEEKSNLEGAPYILPFSPFSSVTNHSANFDRDRVHLSLSFPYPRFRRHVLPLPQRFRYKSRILRRPKVTNHATSKATKCCGQRPPTHRRKIPSLNLCLNHLLIFTSFPENKSSLLR